MTQAEFEALQVGDVVRHDYGFEAVVFLVDADAGVVSVVYSKTPQRSYKEIDEFGQWFDHDYSTLQDWSVVSRVLSRENVQVKGGE